MVLLLFFPLRLHGQGPGNYLHYGTLLVVCSKLLVCWQAVLYPPALFFVGIPLFLLLIVAVPNPKALRPLGRETDIG